MKSASLRPSPAPSVNLGILQAISDYVGLSCLPICRSAPALPPATPMQTIFALHLLEAGDQAAGNQCCYLYC